MSSSDCYTHTSACLSPSSARMTETEGRLQACGSAQEALAPGVWRDGSVREALAGQTRGPKFCDPQRCSCTGLGSGGRGVPQGVLARWLTHIGEL